MQLSIIVPVYNAEKYLPRCLDSITKQIKNGVELILVDDGSQDKSGEICDVYAKKQEVVRVCHQNNGGSAKARNKGMELARGRWITFVDADDDVADSFVDTILSHVEEGLDVVLFEYVQVDVAKEEMSEEKGGCRYYDASCRDLFIRKNFLAGEVLEECHFNMRSVWAKAFRHSLLTEQGIVFKPGVKIGEDMIFTLEVYVSFAKAKCVPGVIYHYYFRNEDSITNRYKPNLQDIIASYVEAVTPWLEEHPEYVPHYASYRLNDIILYMKYDFFHRDNREEKEHKRERMKSVFGSYWTYYETAKGNGMLCFYNMLKRLVFYLALHGHFRLLKVIAWLRYGGK